MRRRHVLLRHGSAGDRAEWDDDDRLRPLDERGRRQAAAIVEPLALPLGAKIELAEALAEGASPEETLHLLRSAEEPTVFCTHGDVVENVLGEPLKKGAAAVVEVDDNGAVRRVGKIKRRD